jgi:hypothetical protein
MTESKRKTIISSDIGGFWATTETVLESYKGCEKIIGTVPNIELISWRHIWPGFTGEARRRKNCRVMGLHGPVGFWTHGYHRIYEPGVDLALLSLCELVGAGRRAGVEYVLVHENVLESGKLADSEWRDLKFVLLLENWPMRGSADRTIGKLRNLKQRRVSSGMMVDLVHLLKEQEDYGYEASVSKVEDSWQRTMELLDVILNSKAVEKVGFHIPIGDREDDSLPLDKISPGMWRGFAERIGKHPKVEFMVLENETAMIRQLMPRGLRDRQKISERNLRILNKLAEYRVIG